MSSRPRHSGSPAGFRVWGFKGLGFRVQWGFKGSGFRHGCRARANKRCYHRGVQNQNRALRKIVVTIDPKP